MDKPDALGLQLFSAHRRYQLGASARSEDKRDSASMTRVAARGADEIVKCRRALTTRKPPPTIGVFATRRRCSIRWIRDDEIEAGRLDARDPLLPQISADRTDRIRIIHRRVPRDHLGQFRLNLNRDDFARTMDRREHDRNNTASRAQLEHAIAPACAREAAEQNRFDRKSISMLWLDQRESSA